VKTKGSQRAQTALGEISAIAGRASTVLGGVAVSQDAIAAASKSAAEQVSKFNEALGRQKQTVVNAPTSSGSTTSTTASAPDRSVAGYKAQVQAVKEAQQAWQAAQAEANRLAAAIKGTTEPTAEMQRAFLLAQEASKAAKVEFLSQGAALGQLRGVANSTFAEFDKAAAKMAADAAEAAASANAIAGASAKAANAQGQIASERSSQCRCSPWCREWCQGVQR
jgi:hypothetical protein